MTGTRRRRTRQSLSPRSWLPTCGRFVTEGGSRRGNSPATCKDSASLGSGRRLVRSRPAGGRVALEEALALSVVLNDETGELYDCDGPISLSPSWDVSGLMIALVAEASQLAEARRHRDRLRREADDSWRRAYMAKAVAEESAKKVDEADREIAELEARLKQP